MAPKTVVILGGGIGGIVAANELRRKLPEGHRVVLVERNAEHAFATSFLWLMTGDRRPEDIRRPLASLLQTGVEFVHASAEGLDLARQHVATTAGNIDYDYLIVALGAELAPEAVPGLKDGAETFYTVEGAARLRDVLSRFFGGRVALVVAAMPYKCPGGLASREPAHAGDTIGKGLCDRRRDGRPYPRTMEAGCPDDAAQGRRFCACAGGNSGCAHRR